MEAGSRPSSGFTQQIKTRATSQREATRMRNAPNKCYAKPKERIGSISSVVRLQHLCRSRHMHSRLLMSDNFQCFNKHYVVVKAHNGTSLSASTIVFDFPSSFVYSPGILPSYIRPFYSRNWNMLISWWSFWVDWGRS